MEPKDNPWRAYVMIGSLGTEVILLTVLGAWLGSKLDAVWGTKPILLLVGVLLGLGLGFVSAVYTIRAFTKE
jgi:F0F1-type ATP synthase assembly protein I